MQLFQNDCHLIIPEICTTGFFPVVVFMPHELLIVLQPKSDNYSMLLGFNIHEVLKLLIHHVFQCMEI